MRNDGQPQSAASSPNPPPACRPSGDGPGEPAAEKLLKWAAHEAKSNAERHEKAQMLGKPIETLAEKFGRLAQEDCTSTAVRDRLARREEERRRKFRVETLLETNGVPAKYRAAALNQTSVLPVEVVSGYHAACQDLLTLLDHPGIIVLLGMRGAGKTHMACGLVNAFCHRLKQATYAKASDYFLRIDEAITLRESVLKVEQAYLRPDLLVLDAMEERADTVHKDRMLVRLIDKRYDATKSTLLISNETEAQFNARVGESVADRIRDDGQKIECRWPSLRGRVAGRSP